MGSRLWFAIYSSQGYYQAPSLGGGIYADYLTYNPDAVSIQYAGFKRRRLPAYHRLDMNISRTFELVGGGDL